MKIHFFKNNINFQIIVLITFILSTLQSVNAQLSMSYHGIEFHKAGLAYHYNDKFYSELKVNQIGYHVRSCIGYSSDIQKDFVFDISTNYNFYKGKWIETYIGLNIFAYKFKSTALTYSYRFQFGTGVNLGLRVFPLQRLKNLSLEFLIFPNTGLRPFSRYFQTELGIRYKINFSK